MSSRGVEIVAPCAATNARCAENFALADFDVAAADVTALTTARTTFVGIKTSPRQAAVGRKTQTDSLPQLIANVRSIFRNEINKLVTKKRKRIPISTPVISPCASS